jgi:hypothetical protein
MSGSFVFRAGIAQTDNQVRRELAHDS